MNDLEMKGFGIVHGLIEVLSSNLPGGSEEKIKKPLSG
jgi:hypothetical protein